MKTRRIGEADNPGPDSIITVNVTSWSGLRRVLHAGLRDDVIVVQEHKRTEQELRAARAEARREGWNLLALAATAGEAGAPAGGVGVLLRRGAI